MPLPPEGAAAADPRARPSRRGAVLRGIGFGLGIALGAVAVWLIVTGTSQKRIELGVLAGLWGVLLAALAAFGVRRAGSRPGEHQPDGGTAYGLVLRGQPELQRADESAARLRFEARLEQMLRQEIQTTFGREIAALREEVASLRNDLLEKVGGQLRLERIETTRVIGSDIEALYREIDQLKHGAPRELAAFPVSAAAGPEPVASAGPPPDRAGGHPAPADVPAQPRADAPAPARVDAPAPGRGDAPAPARADAPAPATSSLVLPPPGADGDPFAKLPRLQPFTDRPLPGAATPKPAPVKPAPAKPPTPSTPVTGSVPPPTVGPRREPPRTAPGRHGHAEPDHVEGGGRRRRSPDAEDNVLARILARESTNR